MRIGILTLPLHTNYGGILQAFALKTVLEKRGHSVKIFDYNNSKLSISHICKLPYYYIKRIIANVCGQNVPLFWEHKLRNEQPIIREHINRFIEKNIDRYTIDSFSEIRESEYDAIIVGSDQVWRPKYFEQLFNASILEAYLNFAKQWNVRRIAYAVSFGVDEWEYTPQKTSVCRTLIKKFDAVSVREESAVRLCEDNLEVDAKVVLDPTMLLDIKDYVDLISDYPVTDKHSTIMTYILDNSKFKMNVVEEFKRKTGYRIYSHSPESYDINENIDKRILPSVEDWIDGFYSSEFIITDSFHACVFSILFQKPFAVIINEDRGATRFYSLLRLFGLEDRIVRSLNDINDSLLNSPLPESVNARLKEFREYSFNFLNILENE